jgi:hypothetical protein
MVDSVPLQAAQERFFQSRAYHLPVKTALLVVVAALLFTVCWEEVFRRYETYDISSTSNCCACKLTVVVLDTWTGKTDARSLPAKPVSDRP